MEQQVNSKPWWCHTCAKQYTPITGYACTECGGEFVEELSQPDPNLSGNPNTAETISNNTSDIPGNPAEMNNNRNMPQQFQWVNGNMGNNNPIGSILQQILNPLLSQSNVINMTVSGSPYMMYSGQPGLMNPFSILQSFANGGIVMGDPIVGNMGDYAGGNIEDVINRLFQQYEKKGNPPASAEVIKNLKTSPITKEQLDQHQECAICKVEYTEGEESIVLPCAHVFHDECIKKWLQMHNTCPVCRYEFPTDDKDYEKIRGARGNPSGSNTQ